MRNYRMAYDCVFLPNDVRNGVIYKGEQLKDISIYFVYSAISKETGEEYFFSSDELQEQLFQCSNGNSCYINNFYKCMIDEHGYKMILNEKLAEDSEYNVTYKIGDCFKYINDTPYRIKYEEFLDILQNNIKEFNNSNNKPTQCCSCYYEEYKKENPLLYGTSGAGSVWSDFRNNDEFLKSILNKIKPSVPIKK